MGIQTLTDITDHNLCIFTLSMLSVQATEEWIQAQVPGIVKEAISVSSQGFGASETPMNADADMEALAQAHVNILAGACLSIGKQNELP